MSMKLGHRMTDLEEQVKILKEVVKELESKMDLVMPDFTLEKRVTRGKRNGKDATQ